MPTPCKPIPPEAAVALLCPHCALCCNGVLFKDVELQPGDDATKLRSLGLPISGIKKRKFPQPCEALDGCRCCLYANRPLRCRQFECALLKSVQAGKSEVAVALRIIRQTWHRADQVRALLRKLEDVDETLALSLRFKRTKKRFETSSPDEARAEMFGHLTLAVHDLNLLLREFYP